jgi:hypothetical protein
MVASTALNASVWVQWSPEFAKMVVNDLVQPLPLGSPILCAVAVSEQPSAKLFLQAFITSFRKKWNTWDTQLTSYNGSASASSARYVLPYRTADQCRNMSSFFIAEQSGTVGTINSSTLTKLISMVHMTSLILPCKGPLPSASFDKTFDGTTQQMSWVLSDISNFEATDAGLQLWHVFESSRVNDKVVLVIDGLPIVPMCAADTRDGSGVYTGRFGIEIIHSPRLRLMLPTLESPWKADDRAWTGCVVNSALSLRGSLGHVSDDGTTWTSNVTPSGSCGGGPFVPQSEVVILNRAMVGDFSCVLSYTNSTMVVGLVYGPNADPANFTYASENNASYDKGKTSLLEAFSSSKSSMETLKCLYQKVDPELSTSTATVYTRYKRTGNLLTISIMKCVGSLPGEWNDVHLVQKTDCVDTDKVLCVIGHVGTWTNTFVNATIISSTGSCLG